MSEKVEITWLDAATFGLANDIEHMNPTKMVTVGTLYKDTDTGVVISDPETTNTESGHTHPRHGQPTYLYVPHAAIKHRK